MSKLGRDQLSRRQVLQLGGAAAAAGVGWGCNGARGREPVASDQARREGSGDAPGGGRDVAHGGARDVVDDRALDEVLDRLHRSEPRVRMGMSSHAPMVAEALCAMGHGDRAMAWVDGYDAPVLEVPVPRQRIDAARWRDALGPRLDSSSWELSLPRWGDWKVFFVEELAGARWQEVLDRWVARLGPGLGSAATHGVIRTAHAARALSRRDTPVRRAELARGLAYWAAAYEELPARTGVAPAPDYRAALARLPLYSDRTGARRAAASPPGCAWSADSTASPPPAIWWRRRTTWAPGCRRCRPPLPGSTSSAARPARSRWCTP